MIKKGYIDLYRPEKQEFSKRFFALFGGERTKESRLDWYENENQFLEHPNVRKTIYLNEVALISKKSEGHDLPEGSNDSNKTQIFVKTKGSRNYLFRFLDPDEMRGWMLALKVEMKRQADNENSDCVAARLEDSECLDALTQSDDFHEFSCYIDSTASALRSSLVGPSLLLVYPNGVKAVNVKNQKAVVWKYSYIRRFGASFNSLTLEGGHLSGLGEGLFIFRECSGQDIAKLIRERANQKSQKLDSPKTAQPIIDNQSNSATPDLLKKLPDHESTVAKQPIYQNETVETATAGKKDKTKSKKTAENKDRNIREPVVADKLSNALASISQQMRRQKETTVQNYEYNSLDITLQNVKPSSTKRQQDGPINGGGENLYGMLLVNKGVRNEPEIGEYAEISDVMKNNNNNNK